MRVAWVAGHDLDAIGGAEMSDRAFIEHAPRYGVEVDHVRGGVPARGAYDRVICSRPDMLGGLAMSLLAALRPVVLAHSSYQHMAPWAKPLLEAARLFFAVSPRHLEAEQSWLTGPEWALTPLWFDTSDLAAEPKEDFALWPHRIGWNKDLSAGRAWAEGKGVPLVVMHDRPVAEVHAAMRRARWVVLFSDPRCPEPGNRAVREGYVAGCEPVINEHVWSLSWDYTPGQMREAVDDAPRAFWERVKQS